MFDTGTVLLLKSQRANFCKHFLLLSRVFFYFCIKNYYSLFLYYSYTDRIG
jgi:hypothetical protein